MVNTPVTLTATVDDAANGGSDIASAEWRDGEGGWTAMNPVDGFEEIRGRGVISKGGDGEIHAGRADWLIKALQLPERQQWTLNIRPQHYAASSRPGC